MPTPGGPFHAWKHDGWRMECLDSEQRGKRRQARLQHPPTLPWPSDCPSSSDNLTGGRAPEMPPDDAAAQQAGHEKKTSSTPRVFTAHGPCKSFFAPPRRRPHAAGHWPFRKEGAGPERTTNTPWKQSSTQGADQRHNRDGQEQEQGHSRTVPRSHCQE